MALASGARLRYDYLVLATGATHSYFGNDQWKPLAPGLKTIEDAIEIRRRVLLAFELAERQMLEARLAPAAQLRRHRRRAHRRGTRRRHQRHLRSSTCATTFATSIPPRARVLLLDGGPRVLAAYPPDLSAKAEAELKRLDVEVHTSTHVTGVGPGWVEAKRSTALSASKPSSRSGPQACRLRLSANFSARPLDRRGCVIVDGHLNPPGLPDIFVLGDLAHFVQDGHQVPGVAQPAMQMGDHVGKMIAADLAGKTAPPSATSTRATWPPSAAWLPLPM